MTNQPRILIVDDEPDCLSVFLFALKDFPAHVDGAPNAVSALQMHRAAPYDLMVLDMWMPVMDGLQLAATLRMSGDKVGIVFLTAHSDHVSEEGLQFDPVAILHKPILPRELKSNIAAILNISISEI